MRDIMFALRGLRKAPGFTAVSIVSLALAIGANSAIFSLIDSALLRPIPGIRQPSRIAVIYRKNARESSPVRLTLLVSGGDLPENVPGELASDNYFDVLGTPPQLGRIFVAGERDDVVVLSDP
jgi:putative ABC transport system permease protein